MAEIAAGAVVAEQVVSTTIEGGVVAGYAVAKPTQPLKGSLSQIPKARNEGDESALARSHLSVTVIGDKAYIFGGETTAATLPSNDVHSLTVIVNEGTQPQHTCHAAAPLEDNGHVPASRTRHAACSRGKHLIVSGGCSSDGSPVDEDACLWLWDSERIQWARVHAGNASAVSSETVESPGSRLDHAIFADDSRQDIVVLHGGRTTKDGEKLKDSWIFDFASRTWAKLPEAPAPADHTAYVDGKLYTITGNSDFNSELHVLQIGESNEEREKLSMAWETISFPTNPLTPGPRPREGSALLPVTTGLGRQYLVYIFGSKHPTDTAGEEQELPPFYSDIWTLQLPSKSIKPTSWTDIKPAIIKDAIREKLGYDSGVHSWGEVDVQPSEQTSHEGKVHPGPRGFFGADIAEDRKTVVLWGGTNAKGEKESDGWTISLS